MLFIMIFMCLLLWDEEPRIRGTERNVCILCPMFMSNDSNESNEKKLIELISLVHSHIQYKEIKQKEMSRRE